jgi:PAS domain S-box-containing protein
MTKTGLFTRSSSNPHFRGGDGVFIWGGNVQLLGDKGMKAEKRTKEQLIHELAAMRQRVAELEQLDNERKRAEEALLESERRYRLLAENVCDVIWTMDINFKYTYLSPSIQHLRGYSVEEAMAQKIEDVLTPTSLKVIGEVLLEERGIESSEQKDLSRSRTVLLELKCKDGTTVWTEVKITTLRDSDGQPIEFIGVTRDITERKRAEEVLRESEERYRSILDNIEDGYFEVDLAGNFTFFNDSLLRELGYSQEEMMGMNNRQYMDKETVKRVYQAFNRVYTTGESYKAYDWELTRKDGSKIIHESSISLMRDAQGERIGFRGVTRNITGKKKAEEERAALQEQLRQAQKMEAIGTLAGGIAHDFNNILGGILGYAELAGLDIPEGSEAKYNLQQSIKSTYRAKDLVQQILAFSRQSKQERKPLDIRAIIKEALKLLRASLPSTIEIRQNIEADWGAIEADPTQIHQVLMNLCTNAAHAMSENGGVLEVSLTKFDMDAGTSGVNSEIEPGPYLKLRVSDTGSGMPPEILSRIFDPYFTTKETGKGTGLGLAVVHGIVKSHRGVITVSSEPGKGTTFDIYFPTGDIIQAPSELERIEPLPLGGGERVLFVDDEKAIVEIGQKLLERLGYEVVGRTSSVEALELFRAKPESFELVITDMTMPNMTGDKLARELMGIRPGIPVILCTGFSERITEEKAKLLGIREFVMKPLVMKDLAKSMRRALDRQKKKKG